MAEPQVTLRRADSQPGRRPAEEQRVGLDHSEQRPDERRAKQYSSAVGLRPPATSYSQKVLEETFGQLGPRSPESYGHLPR